MNKLYSGLIFVLTFFSANSFLKAQDSICGTPGDKAYPNARISSTVALGTSIITANVVFHIVGNSAAESSTTEVINLLNQNFLPHKIQFNRLCVNYIPLNVSVLPYKVPSAINIFIYAYINPPHAGGIGSNELHLGVSHINTSTLTHEMGHCLFLFHTFNERGCMELVDGSNCDICGDEICDTPADPDLYPKTYLVDANCVYFGLKLQDGKPYNPDTHNFMSYSRPECRDRFSPQQGIRMYNALLTLDILKATTKPLQISGPGLVCTTGTFTIPGISPSSQLQWTTNTPAGISINPTTGAVTRLNQYNGFASVTVTHAVCGIKGGPLTFYVGNPAANISTLIYASGSRGVNPVSLNPASTYSFSSDQVPGATSYTWYPPSGFSFLGANGSSSVFITTPSNASGSYSLSCAATNACGYSFTNSLTMQFGTTGGGGTGSGGGRKPPIAAMAAPPLKVTMYPNPTIHGFIVNVTDTTADQNPVKEYEVRLFDQSSREVLYIKSTDAETHIPVDHLLPNVYYLVIQSKEGILKEELLISH